MGKFVRNIVSTPEFDGDRWRIVLKPMTHSDAVRFMEVLAGKDEASVYRLGAELIPSYIVEVSGGTDAAGQPVTAQDVCTLAYFAPLLTAVIADWIAGSMPGN